MKQKVTQLQNTSQKLGQPISSNLPQSDNYKNLSPNFLGPNSKFYKPFPIPFPNDGCIVCFSIINEKTSFPISGATIQIVRISEKKDLRADNQGQGCFLIARGRYQVEIKKEGYEPQIIILDISDNYHNQTFTLKSTH